MRRLALILVCLVASPHAARADGAAPSSNRALVLLRVLAYDHNLAARAGDSVSVMLVYDAANDASRAEHALILEGLDAISSLRVAGLPFRVISYSYTDAEALNAKVARMRPAALYLCGALGRLVESISATTRAEKVVSFTSSDAFVRSGFSVGILAGAADKDKTRIIINVAASKSEGAAFDAGLLKLVEVVK